jgi:hypothetical protein
MELAMHQDENNIRPATDEQAMILYQYRKIRARSLHKMNPIPVYRNDRAT